MEKQHSKQFDDVQRHTGTAKQERGKSSKSGKGAAKQERTDPVQLDFNMNRDSSQENMYKSREKLGKAGAYGSNQDLSLSSQSKVLQTQKRRWKARDALDSKEQQSSPHVDEDVAEPGGFKAPRDQFAGSKAVRKARIVNLPPLADPMLRYRHRKCSSFRFVIAGGGGGAATPHPLVHLVPTLFDPRG